MRPQYDIALAMVRRLAFRHNLPAQETHVTFLDSPDTEPDANSLRRNLRKEFKSAVTGKKGPRLTEYSARILAKAGFVFIPLS